MNAPASMQSSLFPALANTCLNKNIEFTVAARIKDDLKIILANAGFNNIISN